MAATEDTLNVSILQLEMKKRNRQGILDLIRAYPHLLRATNMKLSVAQYAARGNDRKLLEEIDQMDSVALFVVGRLHLPAILMAAQTGNVNNLSIFAERIQVLTTTVLGIVELDLTSKRVHTAHASMIKWVLGGELDVQSTFDHYLSFYTDLCGPEVDQTFMFNMHKLGATIEESKLEISGIRRRYLHNWLYYVTHLIDDTSYILEMSRRQCMEDEADQQPTTSTSSRATEKRLRTK